MSIGSLARLLAFVSVLGASACGPVFQEYQLVQPGVPTGTVVVQNQTGQPISLVIAGPCCSRSLYSANVLGPGQVIPQGGSFAFPVSAGDYNLQATSGSGGIFSIAQEHFQILTVTPGQSATWVVR